jgi:hypothetical protein
VSSRVTGFETALQGPCALNEIDSPAFFAAITPEGAPALSAPDGYGRRFPVPLLKTGLPHSRWDVARQGEDQLGRELLAMFELRPPRADRPPGLAALSPAPAERYLAAACSGQGARRQVVAAILVDLADIAIESAGALLWVEPLSAIAGHHTPPPTRGSRANTASYLPRWRVAVAVRPARARSARWVLGGDRGGDRLAGEPGVVDVDEVGV